MNVQLSEETLKEFYSKISELQDLFSIDEDFPTQNMTLEKKHAYRHYLKLAREASKIIKDGVKDFGVEKLTIDGKVGFVNLSETKENYSMEIKVKTESMNDIACHLVKCKESDSIVDIIVKGKWI